LIPRPETELLVEKAIAWLQNSPVRKTVADIGTGSGAIAVSIAVNVSNSQVLGTDISRKALDVARRNAVQFEVDDQIDFLQCDLLPQYSASVPTETRFDLICANLPYIPTETLHQLPIFGREPTIALDGGRDGLDLIQRLLNITPQWLATNGMMLLEIEATHGDQALRLARRAFPQASLDLHKDLAGRERLLQILT
jgi:release factor glutamine methyltransferase